MSNRIPCATRAVLSVAVVALFATALPHTAYANPAEELVLIKQMMAQMRLDYEQRMKLLEDRLKANEQATPSAPSAQNAPSMSSASSPAPAELKNKPAGTNTNTNTSTNKGGFNPDISLVLSGQYARLSRDPQTYRLKGFTSAGELGPGERSFNLGESELGISGNIDQNFYGAANLALAADNSLGVEEAFIQTTALPKGLSVKAGRFLSGLGYLNEKHAPTWDFADAPLAYQAFFGGQFKQEGLQGRWVLPTKQFIELVAEAGRGAIFPGAASNVNKAGAMTLGARTGGDFGTNSNWRLGAAMLRVTPTARESGSVDALGADVNNAFTGKSTLAVLDGVWKWAPKGNAKQTNFTLQGEYFRRKESGNLSYDLAGANTTDAYTSAQSGWYVQGVYQFMPAWRVGLRTEQLKTGMTDYGSNNAVMSAASGKPSRNSIMLDWTPSEFSRIRLQVADDKSSLAGKSRNVYLQYQMSLGAHGAHSY